MVKEVEQQPKEGPPALVSEEGNSKKQKDNTNNDNKKKKGNSKQETEPLREWNDELQKDYELILSVGEECITEIELKNLLLRKGRGSNNTDGGGFNLYDGFEPSGRMHIAQGIFKAVNVNKCTNNNNNGTFIFWVADWFALMNDKMGGDLDKIKVVGYYLIEVWKAAGMNLNNVIFKWASEEITNNAKLYWPIMLDIARRFNITRIKKCCQIMGRLEGSLTAAQILYPLMQCTDIFFLNTDICQLGVDQRKVNMLAREYCDSCKRKYKPIILSHHMLYGLKQGQEKMSKSDPDSAIFMEDTIDDVTRKINNAYCPSTIAAIVDNNNNSNNNNNNEDDAGKESMQLKYDDLKNPCLDYIQNIILSPPNATYTAAGITYTDFDSVKTAFINGTITEQELKHGLIDELNKLLQPVRDHFTNNDYAKDLLDKVRQYKKETVNKPDEKSIRRLNLVQLQKVKPNTHLVLAPLPTTKPTLQDTMDILAQLRQAAAAANNDNDQQPVVLLLQDWSAIVCNACNGEQKGITAYYTVLQSSLIALDTEFITNNVQFLLQSDAILADPSNYWISVINIGRHFMLEQIMGSDDLQDSDGVGYVIARLMSIADIIGIEPKSISLHPNENTIRQSLIEEFYNKQLPGMITPNITKICCTPTIRLQQEREVDALITDNDEYYILDDPKVHGKSKLNKSFAQEQNIEFCPALNLASVFVFGGDNSNVYAAAPNTLTVQRTDANGGNKTYNTIEELRDDYVSGALHPGDLKKNAMADIMVTILEKLNNAYKADKNILQATKTLKTLQKTNSNKK